MQQLIEDIKACNKCELYKNVNRKVIGRGSQTPKVLFIGEAPGAEEDRTGKPFCGASGQLLTEWINYLEIKDYAIINCLKCRPPGNADPTREQLDACREWLVKQIAALQPEIIFLVGRFAAKEVGEISEGITSVAGKIFERNGQTFTVMPHPSYYLRKGGVGWESALEKIKKFLDGASIVSKEEANSFVKEIETIDMVPSDGGLTPKIIQAAPYVPLHVHTTYSVQDSCTRMNELVNEAKDMGINALAITDHGTISGWWEFQEECQKANIKSLLGIEFYVADNFEAKTKTRYHILAIAKNETGLRNIFKLNELSHDEGYYYKPRIRLQDLFDYSEGLVITSACVLGIVNQKLKEKVADGERVATQLKNKFGNDFYLELQLHDFDDQYVANKQLLDIARRKGIPIVVTTDAHYITKNGKRTHDALKAVMYNKKFGEAGFSIDTNYLMDISELYLYADKHGFPKEMIDEAIENTFKIADKCDAKLKRFNNAMPKFKGELHE